MKKNIRRISSALILGLVFTVGITTMAGAKTTNKQYKTTNIMRMECVDPGVIPVTK